MSLKRNSFESMKYTGLRTKESSKSPNCFMNWRNSRTLALLLLSVCCAVFSLHTEGFGTNQAVRGSTSLLQEISNKPNQFLKMPRVSASLFLPFGDWALTPSHLRSRSSASHCRCAGSRTVAGSLCFLEMLGKEIPNSNFPKAHSHSQHFSLPRF